MAFSSTSPPYTVERFGGDVRYVLPRRELGRARRLCWMLVGIGLFGTAFMCFWMGLPMTWGIGMLLDGQWFGLLLIGFGLLGLGGLIPALYALALGLAAVCRRSQCTVVIRDGKLYSNEHLIFFNWRRKRRVDQIERLSITSAMSLEAPKTDDDWSGWDLGDLGYAISAEGHGIRRFPIAPGYPREVLLPLAKDLAVRIEAEAVLAGFEYSAPRPYDSKQELHREIEVLDDAADTGGGAPPPRKPVDSEVIIDRHAGGLTVTVPAAGVRKGSKGLFSLSVIWNGFMVLFTAVLVRNVLFGDAANRDPDHVGSPEFLLFTIPFWVAGIWMLVAAVNAGRRRALLAVSGDVLRITRETLFRTRHYEFPRDRIDRIGIGPSGMEMNNQPIHELQVHSLTGKKLGLLRQRTDEEIHWIAAELNRALGLSHPLAVNETRSH